MQPSPSQQRQLVNDLARRYGVSAEAVLALLQALVNGRGTMAQFNHPELGGTGQWMQGGMTMVGDLFDHGLRAKVDGLCAELSALLTQPPSAAPSGSDLSHGQDAEPQQQDNPAGTSFTGPGALSKLVAPPRGHFGNWWPAELGAPNGSGGQNQFRYAYFANASRLAVEVDGHVTIYDTLDHQVNGVAQQQGDSASLTFTSQRGQFQVAELPIISVDGEPRRPAGPTAQ